MGSRHAVPTRSKRAIAGVATLGLLWLCTGAEASSSAAEVDASDSFMLEPEPAASAEPTSTTVLASAGQKQTVTPRKGETAPAQCAQGMVEVKGEYCPSVEQKCLKWLDPQTKLRCAEFAPGTRCLGKTVSKHVCIDKYEFPNKAGETPVVMKTWYEARNACKAQGKRLCTGSEWTLACEGSERLPYPYGYSRNAEACNIDKPRITPNERALGTPSLRDAEVERLDQRVASGSYESCVSPYGVHDMVGNVDEWVVNETKRPYQSGSKGGYWGPVRTRCRPMTTAHYEMFSFYQLGFRCCADPGNVPEGDDTSSEASAQNDVESNEPQKLGVGDDTGEGLVAQTNDTGI